MLDTEPREAVSIIECDMKVDFAAPVGYKSPEPQRMETNAVDDDTTSDVSGIKPGSQYDTGAFVASVA